MDHPAQLDQHALIAGETVAAPMASADDLSWAVVKMRAGGHITVNEALIAAYQGRAAERNRKVS